MSAPTNPNGAGPDSDDDDKRVARAAAGDGEALEELLAAFGPGVRAGLSISRRLARDLDADDVMQATYLEACLRIRSLRTRSATGFASWLARIADNNLRDAVRGVGRGKRPGPDRRVTRGAESETARTLLGRLASSTATAGRRASEREAVEILRAAVGRLPRRYREVVEQCDLAERPVREVAEERGSSTGAVHMLRARAHDRLRELLGPGTRIFPDLA